MKLDLHEDYVRSLMFGLQDGLVSTTGVVVGISSGVSDKSIIILASLVAVTVEATSMAAGQYSSEKAVHQNLWLPDECLRFRSYGGCDGAAWLCAQRKHRHR